MSQFTERVIEATLLSGTRLSINPAESMTRNVTEAAKVSVRGSKLEVIQIAQQLAWFCAVFRETKDENLTKSKIMLNSSKNFGEFIIKPLRLEKMGPTQTCWHPLFTNGIIAYDFPVRPRLGQIGVELPMEAMLQLAGVIGPVYCRGGIVFKGYSTIIFPKSMTPSSTASGPISTQWHLVYKAGNEYLDLSSASEFEERLQCTTETLESLVHSRTFLGCYKEVNVHLATEATLYHQIANSNAKDWKPKPQL